MCGWVRSLTLLSLGSGDSLGALLEGGPCPMRSLPHCRAVSTLIATTAINLRRLSSPDNQLNAGLTKQDMATWAQLAIRNWQLLLEGAPNYSNAHYLVNASLEGERPAGPSNAVAFSGLELQESIQAMV